MKPEDKEVLLEAADQVKTHEDFTAFVRVVIDNVIASERKSCCQAAADWEALQKMGGHHLPVCEYIKRVRESENG